ncbi:hypothetical protein OH146_13025 [Salinibacterium sp. SYSU T00001]|uniref:hypothetical protein n=1 Tax=Homoserinimonas sedimenticola TaxID=2986805 RepID=UPI002235C7F9|nr:hypothetical protein [Salinibacterium sedimenticola]MCW4386697.1 hypothetical protein [Salinibacterium sedimenticola]
MNAPRPLQWGPAAAGVLALTIGLAGCAPTSDYDPGAAERLQERVLAVTTAAASADDTGLLSSLDRLEVELHDARARGQITQTRFDAVMAAIALVRAEAEAATAAEEPAPTVEPTDPASSVDVESGGGGGGEENGSGRPEDAGPPENPGQGNGRNNGNGNG